MKPRSPDTAHQLLWSARWLIAAAAKLALVAVLRWLTDRAVRSLFPYGIAVGLAAWHHGMTAGFVCAGLGTLAALATGAFPGNEGLRGQELGGDRFTSKTRTPTGRHVFDAAWLSMGIDHRLCPSRNSQTNGMVERFNGRISDDLNENMVRAIAKQAEAERERRAKIIHAEGELQAAEKLLQAARMLAQAPEAMQLRYLQTRTAIAGAKFDDQFSGAHRTSQTGVRSLLEPDETDGPIRSCRQARRNASVEVWCVRRAYGVHMIWRNQ